MTEARKLKPQTKRMRWAINRLKSFPFLFSTGASVISSSCTVEGIHLSSPTISSGSFSMAFKFIPFIHYSEINCCIRVTAQSSLSHSGLVLYVCIVACSVSAVHLPHFSLSHVISNNNGMSDALLHYYVRYQMIFVSYDLIAHCVLSRANEKCCSGEGSPNRGRV